MTDREDCRMPLDSLPMESQLAARAWEQAPFWHIDDAIAWIASPDAARAHSLAAYRHFMGHPREPHLGLVGRSVASVARAEVSPGEWSRANAMLHEALRAGAVVAYGRSGDDPHGPIPASSWIEPMRLEYGASDHLVDRDGGVRFSSVGIARDGLFAIAAVTEPAAGMAGDRVQVRTGQAGRPNTSKVAEAIMLERAREGNMLGTLAAECRAIMDILGAETRYSDVPRVTELSLRNGLRDAFKRAQLGTA